MANSGIRRLQGQLEGCGSIEDLIRNLQLLDIQFRTFLFSKGDVERLKRTADKRLTELRDLEETKVRSEYERGLKAIGKLTSYKDDPPSDEETAVVSD